MGGLATDSWTVRSSRWRGGCLSPYAPRKLMTGLAQPALVPVADGDRGALGRAARAVVKADARSRRPGHQGPFCLRATVPSPGPAGPDSNGPEQAGTGSRPAARAWPRRRASAREALESDPGSSGSPMSAMSPDEPAQEALTPMSVRPSRGPRAVRDRRRSRAHDDLGQRQVSASIFMSMPSRLMSGQEVSGEPVETHRADGRRGPDGGARSSDSGSWGW